MRLKFGGSINVLDDAASSICIDDLVDGDADLAGEAQGILDTTHGHPALTDFEHYVQQSARDVLNNDGAARRIHFETFGQNIDPEQISYALSAHRRLESIDDFYSQTSQGPFAPSTLESGGSTFDTASKKEARITVIDASDSGFEESASILTLNIDDAYQHQLAIDGKSSRTRLLGRSFYQSEFWWFAFCAGLPMSLLAGTGNTVVKSGPMGTMLGFIISSGVGLCVVTSLAEMIAFYPMQGGFPGMISEYVDPALGMALGLCYWFSCIAMASSELLVAVSLTSTFPRLDNQGSGSFVWLIFFAAVVGVMGFVTTRMWSRAVRIASMISAVCSFMILIFLWIFNAGAVGTAGRVGFKYWEASRSTATEQYGLFRTAFREVASGATGRFCQVWHGIDQAISTLTGIELVFTAIPEIRNSRRTVRSSVRILYARVALYILWAFTMTIVTDPNSLTFLHISSGTRNNAKPFSTVCDAMVSVKSPLLDHDHFGSWLVQMGRANLCTVFHLMCAFFTYSGVFAVGFRLYGASRTLYGMASSGMIWPFFSWCTRDNVPYVAFSASLVPMLVAFVGIDVNRSWVLNYLQIWATGTYTLTWAVLCFAFIRFYRALQTKKRYSMLRRSADDYPYRSPFQPIAAYFGLVSCLIIYGAAGFDEQLARNRPGKWSAGLFLMSYLPGCVVLVVYLVQKWRLKTRMRPYHQIKLEAAKRRMDNEEWEEDRVYRYGIRDAFSRLLHNRF